MLLDGLTKHQCPFRAVAAAVSSTHIIAQLQFLPFLSERSSVGRLWGVMNSVRDEWVGGTGVIALQNMLTNALPAKLVFNRPETRAVVPAIMRSR